MPMSTSKNLQMVNSPPLFLGGPAMAWRPSCSSLDHRGPQESSSGSCSERAQKAVDPFGVDLNPYNPCKPWENMGKWPKESRFQSETKQQHVLKMLRFNWRIGKRTFGDGASDNKDLTNKHCSFTSPSSCTGSGPVSCLAVSWTLLRIWKCETIHSWFDHFPFVSSNFEAPSISPNEYGNVNIC